MKAMRPNPLMFRMKEINTLPKDKSSEAGVNIAESALSIFEMS